MAAAATGVHLGALVARRLLHRAPFPHSWTSAAAAAAWAARKCRRLHAAVAASSSHEEAPRPHVCGQPRLEPDWTVAAAMAGASFEAYGGLQEQGLAEQHRGGTSLHYLDARYLRTTMAGLLQVDIRSAACLPAADPAPWTSDPYARLCVGDSCYTSATIPNNLNPSWRESCSLYVQDPASQALTVTVMDADFGGPDDHLGSAAHSLRGLCDGQRHELELPLRGSPFAGDEGGGGSGSGGGTVRLACRFVPFAELLAEGAPEPTVDGQRLLASPAQIPLATDWQELLSLAGVITDAMYTPVAFVENEETNTQAWLYWNPGRRSVCVAFRGTEQGKWRDILTDLHLVPAPLDPERVAAAPRSAALAEASAPPQPPSRLTRILGGVEAAKQAVAAERAQQAEEASSKEQAGKHILATAVSAVRDTADELSAVLDRVRAEIEAGGGDDPSHPWVHSGFLTAYDSVRPAVLALLQRCLGSQDDGRGQRWSLHLTGHSLGSALATLCAWDCAHRDWGGAAPALHVYTFGSPRVGSRSWADSFNQLVPDTWRFVNLRDTVATVPRLMGFAHVGHAVTLHPGGEVEVQLDSTQRLGEGLGVSDLTPAVGAAVAAKLPEVLPAAATQALAKVGIEVAAAGSTAEQAAALEAAATEEVAAATAGAVGAAAAAAVSPDALGDIWRQELEAWGLLFDGSALDEHMEPLYLENLRCYLEQAAQQQVQQQQQDEGGDGRQQQAAAQPGQRPEGVPPHTQPTARR